MSTEEYLSVLVSIVVGLGVSHLLTGVGRMVIARKLVRTYWVSLAMTCVIFLAQVQWWWSTIHSGERLAGNFFAFVFFLLAPWGCTCWRCWCSPTSTTSPGRSRCATTTTTTTAGSTGWAPFFPC